MKVISLTMVAMLLAFPDLLSNAIEETSAERTIDNLIREQQVNTASWFNYQVTAEANTNTWCDYRHLNRAQADIKSNNLFPHASRGKKNGRLNVYLYASASKIEKLFFLHEHCGGIQFKEDSINEEIIKLGEIEERDSVQFLLTLVEGKNQHTSRKVSNAAQMGIALTNGQHALDVLVELSKKGKDIETKKESLFWIGQARNKAGAQYLKRYIESSLNPISLREHAIFSLGQNPSEEALNFLKTISNPFSSERLRAKSLFCLVINQHQSALKIANGVLRPDASMPLKKNAVYAIAQI